MKVHLEGLTSYATVCLALLCRLWAATEVLNVVELPVIWGGRSVLCVRITL